MKIPFTLNDEKIVIESNPDTPLMEILREMNCLSVKLGCSKGFCGSCTVLLDGKPVASCKIPVAIIRNCSITTLEYFSKSDVYKLIMGAFKKAGINLCGYCNAGKIFSTYQIINQHRKLTRQEISDMVNQLSPCCTDTDTLVNGVIYAIKDSFKS